MPADEFEKEYMSVADAAEQYKTTRSYWYDLIKAGRIPTYALPGRRGTFLKRKEVEAFWKPRPKDGRQDTTA